MVATVYLEPCPYCPKGKNCKGHVGDEITAFPVDQWVDVRIRITKEETPT